MPCNSVVEFVLGVALVPYCRVLFTGQGSTGNYVQMPLNVTTPPWLRRDHNILCSPSLYL